MEEPFTNNSFVPQKSIREKVENLKKEKKFESLEDFISQLFPEKYQFEVSKIKQIAPTGLMDIKIVGLHMVYIKESKHKRFLQSTQKLNPLSINTTNIDIYIEPSVHNTNSTNLNMTWECTQILGDIVSFQLNFTEPKQISPHVIQDTLIFHAKE